MTLRHMKIFVAVCDENNMTKASRKLYMAQPAVSIAIREIEDYYGVQLFDRISRKLFITEQGRRMLEYARQIIDMFDEMEKVIKDNDTLGKIRVGASMTVGTVYMPQIAVAYSRKCPDFAVSVCVNSSETLEEMLLHNELDFAIIEGVIHSEYLVGKAVKTDSLAAVCSPNNPLAKAQSVTLERFLEEKFLLREKNSGTRELFDSALETHGCRVTPLWESTNTQALAVAASNNIGVSVLPYALVKQDIEQGRLVSLNVENLELGRTLWLIYHKNKRLSKAMSEYISLCESIIGKDD